MIERHRVIRQPTGNGKELADLTSAFHETREQTEGSIKHGFAGSIQPAILFRELGWSVANSELLRRALGHPDGSIENGPRGKQWGDDLKSIMKGSNLQKELLFCECADRATF